MRTPAEIEHAFAKTSTLSAERPFFLVGIGGAGMSALALMLNKRGLSVSGSDSTPSPMIDSLERAGISVQIGHASLKLSQDHQVVLSDAIMLDDSPEVASARSAGANLYRRSQLLGWILKDKKVIAITGTHGKTTTTGMVGKAMQAAGLDPTIVVGAYVPEFGSPVIEGTSEWAVVEACEAYDSFHDLSPKVIVLTNLELDHIDFHGTYDRLRDSVVRFAKSIPEDGLLIYCAEDSGASEIAELAGRTKKGYAQGDWSGELTVPGAHNRLNAAGALSAAVFAGADPAAATRAIGEFRGAERRLQPILASTDPNNRLGVDVIDDYAHHPTEIHASLSALKSKFPSRRLVVVFQPHLYSRTADLIPEFAESLSIADVVVLTDIYPAREDPMPGVSSARICELVTKPCHYVPSRFLLGRKVAQWTQLGDVIVGMGAGNISEFAPDYVSEIRRTTVQDIKDHSKKLRVAVLYGGDSAEREVSLHSGRAIALALKNSGHDAKLFDASEVLLTGKSLSELTGPNRVDVAFLAVHGTNAEDGAIQGLLELLHIPYTGSGIQSSALSMDKGLTKKLLQANGITVPRDLALIETESGWKIDGGFVPCIVKPNAQGSTVGLTFVEAEAELSSAVRKALKFGDILVEEWVVGMEISVPVVGNKALLPVEIAPANGRYDFASKYLPGATEEIIPARLSVRQLDEAMELALDCHLAMNCNGASRTDMIVPHGEDKEIVVLEINTIPGMTATSLLPNSARAMGISMEELCESMAIGALEAYAQKA